MRTHLPGTPELPEGRLWRFEDPAEEDLERKVKKEEEEENTNTETTALSLR